MNNPILAFAIFWGVWILVPIVWDGLWFILQATVVLIWGRDFRKHQLREDQLPLVSVIIPTYNEEENIHECLSHLKIQTYPHHQLEIIVVDNGSVDKTRTIVLDHITNGRNGTVNRSTAAKNNGGPSTTLDFPRIYSGQVARGKPPDGKVKIHGETFRFGEFAGVVDLITRPEKGKAEALNEGIMKSKGEIVITIDSRTFLAPKAIYNMVAKFIEEPKMMACTGNIEINWQMLYERDAKGQPVLDSDGHFQSKHLSVKESLLAKCQFLEYLSGFRIGRQFQDITDSIYTLAGAFSGFRRLVLLTLYDSTTVSEDTDLTFILQRQKFHVGYAADAKAYLRPITSWERLYGQRVRWSRGEMEVFGLHQKFNKALYNNLGKKIIYPHLLITDHTFVFPRLIWTLLLPLMFLFGYSLKLIFLAILLMIGFYIALDFFIIACCWLVVDQDTRQQISRSFHYFLVIWIYRFVLYFFRMSAYLVICKEKAEWTVEKSPIKSIKRLTQKVRDRGRQPVVQLAPAEEEKIQTIVKAIDGLNRRQK